MNRQEIDRAIRAEVQRQIEREVRLAKNQDRKDVIFGKLAGTLVKGGFATVNVYYYSLVTDTWVDSLKTVTAYDFFLGPGESWPAATRVRATWYLTCWVIDQAACEPDTGGGGGGGSPSSQSPATLSSGSNMSGGFYPGGVDYSTADYPFDGSKEYDSLFQK